MKQGWLQPTAIKYVCMGMECAVNDTPRMATPSLGGGEVSNLSKPLGNQDESLTTKKKKNPINISIRILLLTFGKNYKEAQDIDFAYT